MNKENKDIEKPWLNNYDKHVPPEIDYPNISINDLLKKAVNKFPKRTFVQYQWEEFSYDFIYQKVQFLENNLRKLGISKGDRVALILPNIPQFVIAYYAILAIGAIVVAMNPKFSLREFEALFRQSEVSCTFCLEKQKDTLDYLQKKFAISNVIYTSIDDYKLLKNNLSNLGDGTSNVHKHQFLELIGERYALPAVRRSEVRPSDPAIFQFSGGTTGQPKPAIGLHKNIVANSIQFSKWCDLKDGKEVILAAIPLYHVYGMVLAMNMGVAIGANIILISDPRNVDYILEQIDVSKVTFYPGVPTMYHAINLNENAKNGRWKLDSIKACISGSFTLHPDIKNEFERLTGGKLIEGYGLSEAPTATHCNPLYGVNKTGSIGLPLPDVEARIVDIENGNMILPPGEIGELIIRGPQVMAGYYKLPEETSNAIRDGWLYTGDIAKMDRDGFFFLVDRMKSLIKVNGLQVWPSEVESVINSHPEVKECAVGGISDKVHGEKIICWIVPERGTEITLKQIKDWCKQSLVSYKIPSELIILEKIPRTKIGKISRQKLFNDYKQT